MLPLVFLPDTPVLLLGRGPAFAKRRALLEAAGLRRLTLVLAEAGPPGPIEFGDCRLVFVAGLEPADNAALAAAARARGIPINVEDVPECCDFHVPALVRRGDLLLTVSTAGAAGEPPAAIMRAVTAHLLASGWLPPLGGQR
jgi:precorrin-2 dehydrogenase/sirohydrochlorin ferrochelatase